jgi:DNA polymerase delta subunit 2
MCIVADVPASCPQTQLLVDYVREEKRIGHVLVAGNSLTEDDMHLVELASFVTVDVMPGKRDPTGMTLPQQPIFRSLIPHQVPGLRAVTNPYSFSVKARENVPVLNVLATSGQNLENCVKYSKLTECEAMECFLKWRHFAPTAPDTLPCYAYFDQDPFILSESPDLLVCAGTEFSTKAVECGSRTVVVPSFKNSGVAVVVNMRTGKAYPVAFSIDQ